MMRSSYTVKAKIWIYTGAAAWHFITLPQKTADDIRKRYGMFARGWGSLPVTVKVGKTEWKTSVFPDKKSKSYLLPLTAAVRKAENLTAGTVVNAKIVIRYQALED